ncbi:MAG: hydantoinase/oxoprolinase family protein, partial [Gemmobacter sp.]|nr:hydantoinase/oxoprolinase family protein [Gemmobacter sp.]
FNLTATIELVTLRVEATGARHPSPPTVLAAGPMPAPAQTVRVAFASGAAEVPVYDRAAMGAGASFAGPAIITQLDTTTLVAPGWGGTVHPSGAIILNRGAK